MLDLINRFRSDPAREIERVLLGVEAGVSGMGQKLDVAACAEAVAALPPVPPLVFNLQLMESARGHANYMIQTGLTGHYQQRGQPGFTGENPRVRIQATGYRGFTMGENAFRDAVSVWNSHRGFIIDWGDGPGGMQDPPGHRLALVNKHFRETGCAFVVFDKGRHGSTVHNFGNNRNISRLLGGIVFYDMNRNDRFDPGEGVGDVALRVPDHSTVQSWGSGAFRIELKHQRSAVLRLEHDGNACEWSFNGGAENVYLHCQLPRTGDAVYMFKQMQSFKLHLDKMTRAVAVNMWLRTRGYYRNQEQEALINKYCRDYAREFEHDRSVVMMAYYTASSATFTALLADARRDWVNTDADRFFSDAERGFQAYSAARDLIDMIRKRQPVIQGRLEETVTALRQAQEASASEAIDESLHALELLLTRSVRRKE